MTVFKLNTDTEHTAVHLPIKTKTVSLVFFFSFLQDSGILWTHRKTEISLLARNNKQKPTLYLLHRVDKLSFLKHNSDTENSVSLGLVFFWDFIPFWFLKKRWMIVLHWISTCGFYLRSSNKSSVLSYTGRSTASYVFITTR